MVENTDKLTPMFAQYQSIKKDYPDALLFFRMGDFYELFFDDAVIASRELQISLTSRGKSDVAAPMCGVPWHASQSYLAKLIDKGYNVAICEQMEDPKESRGLVKRAVTQVITPGTILDDTSLGAKHHNYLGSVFLGMHDSCGFAWADFSTGQWSGVEFRRQADLWQWVAKLAPAELLIVDGRQPPQDFHQPGIRIVYQPAVNFELRRATERLLTAQGVKDLGSIGLDSKPSLTRACGALIAYLEQTQLRQPSQLLPFQPLDLGKRMVIDELTERNLEIFTRLNGQKGRGTLRNVIDDTITPMGGRLMEDMLRHPWRDLGNIRKIQEIVAFFHANDQARTQLRSLLESVHDLERIVMRISLNRAFIRDYLSLGQSLAILPKISGLLSQPGENQSPGLAILLNSMDDLEDCASLLASALDPECQAAGGEGGIFRRGYHAGLDRQIELLEHGEQKLEELLAMEKERTGLLKLKLGYNRVFGYYFEIPRSGLKGEMPARFIRRQSLANAERFRTEELDSLERELLQAGERKKELETELLENLRLHLAGQKERILQTADILAQLDYFQSLAEVGRRENWVMPEVNDNGELHIREGRHPVVESIIGKANFVANDFHMDAEKRFCLLTGPNMGGKSTILRQVALICLLAQMGAMVPAQAASIGLVDRLFSRVGASDNLAQGQSTFMVEMMETARILRQAGKRSLIILDEIGRGTSTYDGMALAWAIVEDLAGRCQGHLRTLFATHYHELTALEKQIPGLFTMNVAVGTFDSNEILFLHRLLPGPADRSYGVEVARIAGIPYPVVHRARDILKSLEENRKKSSITTLSLPGLAKGDSAAPQSGDVLPEIKAKLLALDPDAMSGEEALGILRELRANLTGKAD